MNSHLTIKAGGKNLALGEDFSVDIDYQNPMFNEQEAFSYPAELPVEGNRHLLANIDDRKSPKRPVDIENTKVRIIADGLPIFDGMLKTSDDEEMANSLSMNIEGGNTLDSLISDLDCRDIPVKDSILIGEKLSRVIAIGHGDLSTVVRVACSELAEGSIHFTLKNQQTSVEFTPQALGFSLPAKCNNDITGDAEISKSEATGIDDYTQNTPVILESFINVSKPYPYKQYCNAQVAYKHYDINNDGTTSDSVAGDPYWVLDADRPASGICFYVQYFLDCLFTYLGLEWDNTALTKIEDFNRLCFFNTKCGYDEVEQQESLLSSNFDSVNSWLRTRGCGAQLDMKFEDNDQASTAILPAGTEFYTTTSKGTVKNRTTLTIDTASEDNIVSFDTNLTKNSGGATGDVTINVWGIPPYVEQKWSNTQVDSVEAHFARMYANSENWPDTSVSTIISSLENQFGIRFIYNAEEKKVTAKLLRDIYRNPSSVEFFRGTIHEMNKVSEKITGVRYCYSDESDSKEQKNNLRDNTRDYDTSYDYIDYPSPKDKGTPGATKAYTTVIDKTYADICGHATNADNTCYIDVNTGNAFRIKIDSEAADTKSMHPAWFEVGQFKGVEMGNCSDENEDYVIEFSSDFQPLPLSDVNSAKVILAADSPSLQKNSKYQPHLVAFCNEDMEHEYVKQYLDYPSDITYGSVYARATLHLKENYNTSGSDDGNSPLQSCDWGLAVAIMRGGGSEASTYDYDENYDGFGNSKWGQTVGSYALTTDSIDQMGNHYDYNGKGTDGSDNGEGRGERFSLKLRAYKGELTTWADGDALCKDDEYKDNDGWYYIKNRGTFDRFMYEHAYFLLNRRKFIVRAEITAAFLQYIRNNWQSRFDINGEVGYINKVSTSISIKNGVEETEIEFYAI